MCWYDAVIPCEQYKELVEKTAWYSACRCLQSIKFDSKKINKQRHSGGKTIPLYCRWLDSWSVTKWDTRQQIRACGFRRHWKHGWTTEARLRTGFEKGRDVRNMLESVQNAQKAECGMQALASTRGCSSVLESQLCSTCIMNTKTKCPFLLRVVIVCQYLLTPCALVVPTGDRTRRQLVSPLAVATQQSVQTPGFGSKDEVEEEAVEAVCTVGNCCCKRNLNFKVS